MTVKVILLHNGVNIVNVTAKEGATDNSWLSRYFWYGLRWRL